MSQPYPLKNLSKVDHRLSTATQGDNRYGGDLLRETASKVNNAIRQHLSGTRELPFLRSEHKNEVISVWQDLVDDVLSEYEWERQILEHKLQIREFRPRTFFSVLPEAEDWKEQIDADTGLKVKHLRINPHHKLKKSARTRPDKRLSILLPIANGYRKTFRALACLCYDIEDLVENYLVEFHICVNFSDDNSLNEVTRFANTMARARALSIALYFSEKHREAGGRGRQGQWWKTVVLNLMLKRIFETSDKDCPPEKHYLHFADDDIYIQPDTRLISKNIEHLNDPTIQVVSASYTSSGDKGFSSISSIRKQRTYVQSESGEKLLNIYGGCMTTTVDRLQNTLRKGVPSSGIGFPRSLSGGEEFSEDCYLTVLTNLDLLELNSLGRIDPTTLAAKATGYAQRGVTVGHQEPTNIVSFAYRVARDMQWGRRSIEACIPESANSRERIQQITKAYHRCRKESFEPIARAIRESCDLRHLLAEAWNFEIRNLIEQNLSRFQGPRSMQAIDWVAHKTQHQICKDLIEDPHVLESIMQVVTQAPFVYELIEHLRAYASEPELGFPKTCQLLIKCERSDIETTLHKNDYLFHLYTIAEESLANAAQFLLQTGATTSQVHEQLGLPKEKLRSLRKTYDFDLGSILAQAFKEQVPVTVAPKTTTKNSDFLCSAPRRSPNSYTVFLWRNPAKQQTKVDKCPDHMFLRYFNVTGRSKFLSDSPRRTVYLQLFGEELLIRILKVIDKLKDRQKEKGSSPEESSPFAQIPKPDFVITRTLYPTLQEATLSYSGPEQRNPFGRLMQSLYIQESIRSKAKQLAAVALGDEQCGPLAYRFGEFLGQIHGVTFGARAYLDQSYVQNYRADELDENDPRRDLIKLLVEYLDQLRRFIPKAYKQWLESGADRLGSISNLLKQIQEQRGTMGVEVAKLLRQDGLILDHIWDDLCKGSEQLHRSFGTIGYHGLYGANLFVGSIDHRWIIRDFRGQKSSVLPPQVYIDKIYAADHSGITITDPAVEAGVVLAHLISRRISAGKIAAIAKELDFLRVDDESLPTVVAAFRKPYYESFQYYLSSALIPANEVDKIDGKRITEDVVTRLSRVAATALLTQYHDKREYDLTPDQREKLIHICVDLLHMGTSLNVRFRDYRIT